MKKEEDHDAGLEKFIALMKSLTTYASNYADSLRKIYLINKLFMIAWTLKKSKDCSIVCTNSLGSCGWHPSSSFATCYSTIAK